MANYDHPSKYPLTVSPVIQDKRVKRVLIDGGSSLNVLFPKTLLRLGIPLSSLQKTDTPFFGIMPGTGANPLGHISLPVTFGTEENFRTEWISYEVPDFDYSYNTIIGWPGLVKFMAIPHYTYLAMKMPGEKGVISVQGDFKTMAECDREALQAALTD